MEWCLGKGKGKAGGNRDSVVYDSVCRLLRVVPMRTLNGRK